MFFYVVSRAYAEIFSLLRICSGLLSNSPGLLQHACYLDSVHYNEIQLLPARMRPPITGAMTIGFFYHLITNI